LDPLNDDDEKLTPAFVERYEVPPPYTPYITTLGSSFAMSVPHDEPVGAMLVQLKPEFVLFVTLVELHAVAKAYVFRSLDTAIMGISDEPLE